MTLKPPVPLLAFRQYECLWTQILRGSCTQTQQHFGHSNVSSINSQKYWDIPLHPHVQVSIYIHGQLLDKPARHIYFVPRDSSKKPKPHRKGHISLQWIVPLLL